MQVISGRGGGLKSALTVLAVCLVQLGHPGIGARPQLQNWTVEPTPNLGAINMAISTTLAVSTTEAWAAGTGVFDYWNGSIWNAIPGAKLGMGHTFQAESLAAVPDTTPVKIWAVGFDTRTNRQMIEQWDGSSWSVVPSPVQGGASRLNGVSAQSSSAAWAAGSDENGALIERWNGAAWAEVTPANGLNTISLSGVVALSAHGVWVVGSCTTQTNCASGAPTTVESAMDAPTVDLAVIEHWNGIRWTMVHSPRLVADLNGVAAKSPTNVWVAGAYDNPYANKYGTLTEHWNGRAWRVIRGADPEPTTQFQTLQGITIGKTAWAAGYATNSDGTVGLVERWTGTQWKVSPVQHPATAVDSYAAISATPGSGPLWVAGGHIEEWDGRTWTYTPAYNAGSDNSLSDITAIPGSPKFWAVGQYVKAAGSGTLIERWNGQRWNVFTGAPIPNGMLNAVDAVSRRRAWAVGTMRGSDSVAHGAIERWNGTEWTLQKNPGETNEWWENLNSVSAIGRNNVWAVGYWYGASGNQALAKHWNGTAWKVIPTPPAPGTGQRTFESVSARMPNDAWAAGYQQTGPNRTRTLIEHWNGHSWRVIPSPNPAPTSDVLDAITAVAPDDAWAVGRSSSYGVTTTLTEHWNGGSWVVVPSVSPSGVNDLLDSVSAVSVDDVWAAGSFSTRAGQRVLVERWNGVSWSVEAPVSPDNGAVLSGIVTGAQTPKVWIAGSYVNESGVQRTLTESGE